MYILKSLRKPYFAIFLASLVLFVSCEQYDDLNADDAKFDYSLFNTYKGNLLDINLLNFLRTEDLSRLELNQAILNEVNLQLDTELDYNTNFKSLEITSAQEVMDWGVQHNLLDSKDAEILNNFMDNTL